MAVAVALQDFLPDGFLHLREDVALAAISLLRIKLLRFREDSVQRDDDGTVCPVFELLQAAAALWTYPHFEQKITKIRPLESISSIFLKRATI